MPRRNHIAGHRRNYASSRNRRRYGGSNRTRRRQEPNILEKTVAKAPMGSDSRMIFRWQKKLRRYATSSFSPLKTDNKMSTQEMEEIFRRLESAKYYRADDGSDFVTCCGILMVLLFVLSLITFLIMVFSQSDSSFYMIFPTAFIGSILCLWLCFVFCLVQSKKWFISRLLRRERSMKDILTDLNRAKYYDKGIYLKVGTYGAWIEFELTYKYNNNGQGLGVGRGDNSRRNNLPKIDNSLSRPSGGEKTPAKVPSRPESPEPAKNIPTNKIQPMSIADARPALLPQGIEANLPYSPPLSTQFNSQNLDQNPGNNDLPPILDVDVPQENQETQFQTGNPHYPQPPGDRREFAKVFNNEI